MAARPRALGGDGAREPHRDISDRSAPTFSLARSDRAGASAGSPLTVAAAAGVEKVGTHDLRHSLVAIAFEEGLSAPEIALLARHANARVTLDVYAGLTDDGREAAALKLTASGFGS